MRAFYRTLRILSSITLFFFCWTFLPLYAAVAYAATPQGRGAAKVRSSDLGVRNVTPQPGERFEKALEVIRENVSRAGEKADRGEDNTKELETIKAKRAEIESADIEFKKEFAVTEKKFKDAKLPNEILDRHAKFIKHYEDNLKELKTNLDDVEQAKTKSDRRAKIEKTRLHLEKVKAPSKHQKLDPNNLPFKARTASKKIAPRLKKEDFERDFPQQQLQNKRKLAGSHLLPYLLAAIPKQKPILLAFNETASDVPFQLPRPVAGEGWGEGATPQFAFADSAPFLLAQATGQPSADDLSETPDVQFTDAIRAKAQELGGKPVNIYNWVRNNIEYAPMYGSIQGADMCLQSKICNDTDTASLLIALLRVSGIYAHYVYGTIQMPIDKAMNWVGGVTDPKMAGTVLATNGIPTTALISGGTIKYEQIEHVWVNAFIDYIPSRGAVHKQGDTWIPLDASYKQYTYTQGIDINAAVSFDAQSFANQILSTATTNTTDGSVTNVNSALVQQTMQDYQTQVQNYIQQNYPNATVGDVIGKKEIIKQEFGILPETLPYKKVLLGSEFAQVPDALRETLSFSIPDATGAGAGLSYSTSLPQLAGKKITLSFSPATANDQAVMESLLPVPHADGSPIQPSELPSSFPAYLINLKPELRIDGQVVATGAPCMMGSAQSFTMSLNETGFGVSNIDNIVQAGEYYGIGLDTGRISTVFLNALKSKLASTNAKLAAQSVDGLSKDDLVGDLLYTTIASYFAELDMTDEVSAKLMNVVRYRAPSVGMFSFILNVNAVFGIPTNAGPQGFLMDVDRLMQTVFSKEGNLPAAKYYMLMSGNNSSALEHAVPDKLFSSLDTVSPGISAVKALKIANDQGIAIYTITQSNIDSILQLLQVNEDTKTDIINAINTGKQVTVSKTNINYNGWIGCGYIVSDSVTGAGAYMISGNANGDFKKLLKGSVWMIASIAAAITAIMLGFWVGLFATIILGSMVTFIEKLIDQSYSVSFKDIALFLTSVIAWTSVGSAFAPMLALGPAGWVVFAMVLLSVVLLDLVITFSRTGTHLYYATSASSLRRHA